MDRGGRPHGAHRNGPDPAAHGAGREGRAAQRDRGATVRHRDAGSQGWKMVSYIKNMVI